MKFGWQAAPGRPGWFDMGPDANRVKPCRDFKRLGVPLARAFG